MRASASRRLDPSRTDGSVKLSPEPVQAVLSVKAPFRPDDRAAATPALCRCPFGRPEPPEATESKGALDSEDRRLNDVRTGTPSRR